MPRIFISYRREDSDGITGRIYDRLGPHFGRDNVFLDIDTIPFGVDFRKHLQQAVGRCDILLAVIGENWLDIRHRDGPLQGQRRLDDARDFVRIEIEAALARDIPVVPVIVGRAGVPPVEALPEGLKDLAYRNAAEVRSGRDFHDHVDRLIRGVEYLLANTRTPVEQRGLDCTTADGVSAADVRRAQEAWAAFLKRPVEETIEISKGVTMTFVLVPPGKFRMGSPMTQEERNDDKTLHEVTLTRPFYLGKHPVTQEQYAALIGSNPSHFKGVNLPVEQVSWEDVQAYAEKLTKNRQDGYVYRLPTEAEWEYACRGGRPSSHAFGIGDGHTLSSREANFNGNYPSGGAVEGPYLESTCRVGSYPANALGLFDMHGNVWEWCADWKGPYPTGAVTDPVGPSQGSDRVLRGGSWYNRGGYCRAANRYGLTPTLRSSHVGFRLARSSVQ